MSRITGDVAWPRYSPSTATAGTCSPTQPTSQDQHHETVVSCLVAARPALGYASFDGAEAPLHDSESGLAVRYLPASRPPHQGPSALGPETCRASRKRETTAENPQVSGLRSGQNRRRKAKTAD